MTGGKVIPGGRGTPAGVTGPNARGGMPGMIGGGGGMRPQPPPNAPPAGQGLGMPTGDAAVVAVDESSFQALNTWSNRLARTLLCLTFTFTWPSALSII